MLHSSSILLISSVNVILDTRNVYDMRKQRCERRCSMLNPLLRYKLHVLASDGKWEDYGTVAVNIVNKNDEAPVFTVNEYYGSVTEELDGPPVFVLQVQTIIVSGVTVVVHLPCFNTDINISSWPIS